MLHGSCLCGVIKWQTGEAPRSVHHCHCSMCRKWTGAAFATLAWFRKSAVKWSGPQPLLFRPRLRSEAIVASAEHHSISPTTASMNSELLSEVWKTPKRSCQPVTMDPKGDSRGLMLAPGFLRRTRKSAGDPPTANTQPA
jgi:hypothetical protein